MLQPNLSQWYHHELDPIAFHWGDAAVPWYWLVYVIGWFWCAWVFHLTFASTLASHDVTTNKNTPIPLGSRFHSAQNDFLLWGWIGLLVGARLTYILVYNFRYFLERPDQVFAIWNGGMSFHGALIGIIIAAATVAKRRQISFFMLTDPLALAIPWILFLGRIANFVNGELVGRISTVPWAVVFPAPFAGAPRHPSQLYESVLEGLLVGVFLLSKYSHYIKRPGFLSFAFMGLYAAARFFAEYTREPDLNLGLIWGLSMGQWLCLAMILCAFVGVSRLNHDS